MIKLFKLFVNFLYFLFTLGLIALIMWGANAAVNIGGSNEDVPNLIKKVSEDPEKSDSENTIYFSDVFGFTMTSVQNAHKSREVFIYQLGSEGKPIEKFWFIPMGWANKTMTWTKNVFIAVFAPSHEIEQMQRYRYASVYGPYDGPHADLNDETYRSYYIDFNSNGEFDTGEDIRQFNDIEGKHIENQKFLNEMNRYNKYNQIDEEQIDMYEKFDKFMNNKPVVKWAFAEVIIIVVLSFIVVYQNPIDFKQTNDGVTEMSKSFIPKFPKPRRRPKKNKRNKDIN